MSTPFAALESRINAAIFKHLPNARGLVDGVAVDGLFDESYEVAGVGIGMASTQPAFGVPTNILPADPVGVAVVVYQPDGVTVRGTYTVAAHEPDGTGLSRLLLEVA